MGDPDASQEKMLPRKSKSTNGSSFRTKKEAMEPKRKPKRAPNSYNHDCPEGFQNHSFPIVCFYFVQLSLWLLPQTRLFGLWPVSVSPKRTLGRAQGLHGGCSEISERARGPKGSRTLSKGGPGGDLGRPKVAKVRT